MKPTIYASFNTIDDAEKATGALMDFGLKSEDITLVGHENHKDRAVHYTGHGMGRINDNAAVYTADTPINAAVSGADMNTNVDSTLDRDTNWNDNTRTDANVDDVNDKGDLSAKTGLSTTTAGDAMAGAGKGAGIGLGVGVAAALAAMFIPGIGLVVGGGTLAMALTGAAAATAGGAMAGGAFGYLKDQGVPDHAIHSYNETFEKGGALLAINLPDDVERASVEVILDKYNAQNVNEYSYAATH